jgi:hypothetical protein
MKKLMTLAFLGCVMAAPALADDTPMPDEYLQKDYENCMGGETPQSSPERAQYCQCIRDGMRHWTVDQYGSAATQLAQSQGKGGSEPSSVLGLAKSCMQKALH